MTNNNLPAEARKMNAKDRLAWALRTGYPLAGLLSDKRKWREHHETEMRSEHPQFSTRILPAYEEDPIKEVERDIMRAEQDRQRDAYEANSD